MKSRAKSAISSSLRSRGMSIVPSEISTCSMPSAESQLLVLVQPVASVDDLEEGAADDDRLPRSTSSFRSRFFVTQAVPQPSLTMSM